MKFIERAFPWILIAPAILPVVIWGEVIYPYLVPKTLLFYALTFIAAAAFLVLLASGKAFFWTRLRRRETWIPAALLVLAYVTSYFGVDFYRSFWSIFVRGDGLLMLTCAVTSFYLVLLSADKKFFDNLLRGVAVIATFVALYGIGEWFLGGGRIGSLLGNAAFFAGYLGIAFFATLAVAQELPRSWRDAAYFGAALQVVAIVFSATRGTMLALIVAGLAYLVYAAVKGERGTQQHARSGLIALIVITGLFVGFRSELAKVPFEPIARVASISTAEADVASRLFIWKHMLVEVGQHPFTGVGAEHVSTLFDRFYDPTQIVEEWFDRSHNAFIDYAAQYGIGGLLLYVLLIASLFAAAMHSLMRTRSKRAGLFALLAITYAVQNFFVFDTVSSFWLFLVIIAGFFAVSSDASRSAIRLPGLVRYGAPLVAIILLVLIVPVSVRPALAAYDLAQAYKYQLVDVPLETDYFLKGFNLSTYGDLEYGHEAYDMYAGTQASSLSGEARAQAYDAALTVLTTDFNRYPYDARTALYLAHVLALAPAERPADQDLLSEALARTIELSPKRAQAWYILVNLSISSANEHPAGSKERLAGYRAAHDILDTYIGLVPTFSQPYFVRAQLEYANGDAKAARASAALGKENYVSNLETARRAAGYYESIQDWENAEFFLEEIVKLAPHDTASFYDLAKVKYLLGDKAGAEEIVKELRSSNPRILETDPNFLNAITIYERTGN